MVDYNKYLMRRLQDYFPQEDVEVRIGSTTKDKSQGQALFYIAARAVQQRLDEVVGPLNWQTKVYEPVNRSKDYPAGVYCEIGIKSLQGEWIWKGDASQNTDFDGLKGGHSKALVRAAVQWGIGRYLYTMGDPEWYELKKNGRYFQNSPEVPKRFTPAAQDKPILTREEVRRLRRVYEESEMDKGDIDTLFHKYNEAAKESGEFDVDAFTDEVLD